MVVRVPASSSVRAHALLAVLAAVSGCVWTAGGGGAPTATATPTPSATPTELPSPTGVGTPCTANGFPTASVPTSGVTYEISGSCWAEWNYLDPNCEPMITFYGADTADWHWLPLYSPSTALSISGANGVALITTTGFRITGQYYVDQPDATSTCTSYLLSGVFLSTSQKTFDATLSSAQRSGQNGGCTAGVVGTSSCAILGTVISP